MKFTDLIEMLLGKRDPALEVNTDELRAKLNSSAGNGDRPHLIDVREPYELAQTGHLEGARHIPAGQVKQALPHHVPDRSSEIVLYCHSGNRSYVSVKELQALGYTDVKSVRGGIRALHRDGFPIVG